MSVSAVILAKNKTNYTNKKIKYLKNTKITEYDIRRGGLSIVKYHKIFPEYIIEKLENANKQAANIYIGKQMAKNRELSRLFIETFSNIRKDFVEINNIDFDDILSIKKDALFIIAKEPKYLTIEEYFTFIPKSIYSSYVYLAGLEIFYSAFNDNIDIKGITNNSRKYQKNFLILDIKKILKSGEKLTKQEMFIKLKNYRKKYLERKLPIDTYRNLITGNYIIDDHEYVALDESKINDINIGYNYINFLLPLIQNILA